MTAAQIALLTQAGFSTGQIESAEQALVDGALVRDGLTQTFTSVSSDGQSRYMTDPYGCNCRAGRKTGKCHHRATAIILTLAA